jgi:hypothetical protein
MSDNFTEDLVRGELEYLDELRTPKNSSEFAEPSGSLHSQLIALAAKWLEARQHAVVITDMSHGGSETPDAIGWKAGYSTLVECKASRSDFLNDRHKYFRHKPERGMGTYRYYATPEGLIGLHELPENWGLIELRNGKLKVTKKAKDQPRSASNENSLLVSAMRRIAHTCPKGVSVRCYTIESGKSRATLGIRKEENKQLSEQ